MPPARPAARRRRHVRRRRAVVADAGGGAARIRGARFGATAHKKKKELNILNMQHALHASPARSAGLA